MTAQTAPWCHPAFIRQAALCWCFLIVLLILLSPSVGDGQVTTTITSSGLNTQVNQVGNSYNITDGTRPGGGPNLFHSFGDFSVGGGDHANFVNNTGLPTSNILGRVTDGNISNIYGTIETTGFGNANLFLMNSSGIVLGPGASLNVGGSVSFTTAQYVRLFDGVHNANFYANPANDVLANSILTINASAFEFLSASPAAYGFLTAPDPNAILTVQGSLLKVPEGRSLSLVGGNITIQSADDGTTQSANLQAPGGRINLVSVASPGEMQLANFQPAPNINGTSFTTMGTVTLKESTVLDVSGQLDEFGTPIGQGKGGTVLVRGGKLVMDASFIQATTLGAVDGEPRAVDIQVSQDVLLSNGATITVGTFQGAGRGGDVVIGAKNVSLLDLSSISTGTFGQHTGGNIVLNVRTLRLLNGSSLSSSTGGLDLDFDGVTDVFGGVGGKITVQGTRGIGTVADSVTLLGGSGITSSTFAEGNAGGGDISIAATSVKLDEASFIRSSTSSIMIDLNSDGVIDFSGRGGNIVLNVQQLRVGGGATITARTDSNADKAAVGGTTTVQGLAGAGSKARSVLLTGQGTAIVSDSVVGQGSEVAINAGTLTITDGATIAAGSESSFGSAGKVTLMTDSTLIAKDGQIISRSAAQDSGQVTITAKELTLDKGSIVTKTTSAFGGRGGDVVINGGKVTLKNGALISSESDNFSTGRAGNIMLNVSTLDLTNGSVISSSSKSTATGNAGSITIGRTTGPAETVTVTDSSVLTTAEHTGQGGSITVNAANLTLKNATISASVKDINVTNPNDGAAIGTGNVTLTGSTIDMTGGTISAATRGARNAGTVSLTAGSFSMANGTITTNTNSNGNAGTINILTTGKGVSLLGGSNITSETTAGGNAGQVFITTPTLTMDNATMTTSTNNTGHAGDILAKVGTLTMTNGSEISSSSTGTATGHAGSLTIQGLASPANAVNLTNSSLLTSAAHTGQGGRISVDTTNLLLNNARISASVKDVPGNEKPSVGTANVALSAESMTMNGSRITAESLGSRNAGNILINRPTALGKHFEMINSQINTSAKLADGGNIEIYLKDMVRLTDSTITSSVGNETLKTTQGGNITIDPDFVVLQRGNIRANAFAGSGGAIDITSGLFLADASSVVDASSTLGLSGTVEINSPINNLSSVVARLPESLLEVQALLRASCAARLAQGETSSFVERGRDGIPAGPDGLLASPYLPATVSQSSLRHHNASAGISAISPQRLFGREMPSSVTLFSDRAACSP